MVLHLDYRELVYLLLMGGSHGRQSRAEAFCYLESQENTRVMYLFLARLLVDIREFWDSLELLAQQAHGKGSAKPYLRCRTPDGFEHCSGMSHGDRRF